MFIVLYYYVSELAAVDSGNYSAIINISKFK